MAWMFSDNDRTKADVDHPVAGIFWHPTYLHCSQVENGDIESFETYTLYLHSTPINWSHMTSKMSPPFWWQFLDGIASPSTYPVSQFSQHLPCQSVGEWVIDSFRMEIAIASPSFASLFLRVFSSYSEADPDRSFPAAPKPSLNESFAQAGWLALKALHWRCKKCVNRDKWQVLLQISVFGGPSFKYLLEKFVWDHTSLNFVHTKKNPFQGGLAFFIMPLPVLLSLLGTDTTHLLVLFTPGGGWWWGCWDGESFVGSSQNPWPFSSDLWSL